MFGRKGKETAESETPPAAPAVAHAAPTLQEQALAAFAKMAPREKRAALAAIFESFAPPNLPRPIWLTPDISDEQAQTIARHQIDIVTNEQSLGFYAEIAVFLAPRLRESFPDANSVCSVLDVGCRTAAGSALLADLFCSYKLRMLVDTLDIDPTWRDYQISRWQRLQRVIIGDLFEQPDKTHDIVLSSHTIEHLSEPEPFIRKMQRIAKKFVVVYCPYNEQNPIPAHRTITPEFIASLGPLETRIQKSYWWRTGPHHEWRDTAYFVLPPL